MPDRDQIVTLDPADTWIELTNGDSTHITVFHRGGSEEVIIQATAADAPTPATNRKGLLLQTSEGRLGVTFLNEQITNLNILADAKQVYALAIGGTATVYVQAKAEVAE